MEMCKTVEDYAITKEMQGRSEERLDAIRNMIKYGVSKERIMEDYSKEEYEKAEQNLLKAADSRN